MTEEKVRMSIKEADRLGIMRQIDKKNLTIKKASEQLGLSLRHCKRVRKRYLQEGPCGLISRKKGCPSNNKISKETRDKTIFLIKTRYSDFGPTLASEKLRERDEILLSKETIRKWMIEEGIWKAKKKKEKRVYQRRTRRSRFGELLQGDGSPHDWFEGRAEKCTLLQFVDDATSKTTAAKFMPSETTDGYISLLEEQLKKYGRPLGLYVDRSSIFRVNKKEVQKGKAITHFGRVLKDLDIELICANSPQAKGRVERKNRVFQDRLIKEMRLQGINTIDEANAFLPTFLEEHNKHFGIDPANPEDAHRPLRKQDDLRKIFARKDQRKLSKDLTFQHQGTLYMVKTDTPNRLKHASIDIFERENEDIEIEYKGKKLKYRKWSETIYERPLIAGAKDIESIGMGWANKKPVRPSRHHPWR
jgi:hypothetical protein